MIKFVRVMLVLLATFMFGAQNASASTTNCAISATDVQFVPSWGAVEVGADSYSKYIYQWMYWDNASRLAWFVSNSDSTFEPDALFDGSGSGSPEFGTSTTAYGAFPRNVGWYSGDVVGYWSSDLMGPYQDTAFGDDTNEWAVTVGSSQAAFLSSGHVYYTVTRMLNGGASSGGVKLSAQRGRRVPVDDYTKWGSYGCSEQPNNIFTLPWGAGFIAPGCRQYWYKWDISTNSPC